MGIEKFSAQQVQAIEELALGKSPAQVAKKLNLSTSSVYKWQQDKDFHLEVCKLVKIAYESAAQEMALMGSECVEQLRTIIKSEDTRTRDKLDAIKLLFTVGDKFREWTNLDSNKQRHGKL